MPAAGPLMSRADIPAPRPADHFCLDWGCPNAYRIRCARPMETAAPLLLTHWFIPHAVGDCCDDFLPRPASGA